MANPSPDRIRLAQFTQPADTLKAYQRHIATCEQKGWDPSEEISLEFDGQVYAIEVLDRLVDASLDEVGW